MEDQFNSIWATKLMRDELIANTVAKWVAAAAIKDVAGLIALLDEGVEFSPQFVEQSFRGPNNMLKVLGVFTNATQNFRYVRNWVSTEGAILEFKADIGSSIVHGLDLLEIDNSGKITKFEVMARPFTAISLLRQAYLESDATP